jgi:hypothetical protein
MRVMHVRQMWMRVPQPLVPMDMRMRFARRIIGRMFMLMMFIVHMRVCMLHRLVQMLMFVALRQVQPHAEAHQ